MLDFPHEAAAAASGPTLPPHIAGSAAALGRQRRESIARAAELGPVLAERAADVDRAGRSPRANFADLRAAGLLALPVPEAHGGGGADYAACALVCAELGRHCAATALCFTMHVGAVLWSSWVGGTLALAPAERRRHEDRLAPLYAGIVRRGQVLAQAFSEAGAAAAGQAPWATRARKVAGGYRIDGSKVFTSMAGAADVYAVLCTLDPPDRPGGGSLRDALVLAVPADAAGLSVVGEWDALGMRGTESRTLQLAGVVVGDDAPLLPEGAYQAAARRHPHMFSLLCAPYMGIAQAALDFTVHYLRAELPGMPPVKRRMYPTKQLAVAEMRMRLEQTRALFLQNVLAAGPDPDHDTRMRLYAAHCSVTENAQTLAAQAIRTCGGQATQKNQPLERLYRDARCGSLMLPLTAELCLDHLGRESLYDDSERADSLE